MSIEPIWTKARYICSILLTEGGEVSVFVAVAVAADELVVEYVELAMVDDAEDVTKLLVV